MRNVTVCCCRCGSPCVGSASVVDFRAGLAREQIGETADYCRECGQALIDWHRSGRQELPELAAPLVEVAR